MGEGTVGKFLGGGGEWGFILRGRGICLGEREEWQGMAI